MRHQASIRYRQSAICPDQGFAYQRHWYIYHYYHLSQYYIISMHACHDIICTITQCYYSHWHRCYQQQHPKQCIFELLTLKQQLQVHSGHLQLPTGGGERKHEGLATTRHPVAIHIKSLTDPVMINSSLCKMLISCSALICINIQSVSSGTSPIAKVYENLVQTCK